MNYRRKSLKKQAGFEVIHLFPPGKWILSLLLFPIVLASCSKLDPNEALIEFKKGNEQYFDFDFKGAQVRYEKALELNPDLPMVRNNLACAKFRQENFEQSIDDLDVITSDFPKFAKSYYNRALANSYQGKYGAAIEDLEIAIGLYQAELDTCQKFCCLQLKADKTPCCQDSLASFLKKVYATDSCYLDADYHHGFCTDICCKQQEPLRDSIHASREEKYESKASGKYYGSKVGRLNTPASDSLEFRTIWLEHALAYAHIKRGLFRQRLKSYAGAISDYDRALELNGPLQKDDSLKTGELYLNRGNCYQSLAIKENNEQGDSLYKKAIHDYITAINNPEDTAINWEARYQMAVCSLGLGINLEFLATTLFEGIIAQQPDDPRPYIKQANCYQALGETIQAIEKYSEALDLDPNQPDAVFNRGNCYIANDQLSLAIADYTACIGMRRDYANAWYMRGITRMNLGDYEGAKGDLNTAGEKGHPFGFKILGELEQKILQKTLEPAEKTEI